MSVYKNERLILKPREPRADARRGPSRRVVAMKAATTTNGVERASRPLVRAANDPTSGQDARSTHHSDVAPASGRRPNILKKTRARVLGPSLNLLSSGRSPATRNETQANRPRRRGPCDLPRAHDKGSRNMFRNGIRGFLTLTALLGCVAFLACSTGCDEVAPGAEIKVQARAAWPLFW